MLVARKVARRFTRFTAACNGDGLRLAVKSTCALPCRSHDTITDEFVFV